MNIASSINTLFQSVSRANSAQETYSRLSNMSDAALAKRGIAREDIPQIVFKEISDF